MSIVTKMTAEALEIAIVEGAISEAGAVKVLKDRYANTPKGRKPSWPSMKLLCKLTGYDMSDTSRVALAAHITGKAANAKAKPATKAKPAPAKAAAMTDKPSGRAKAKQAAKPAAKPDYRAQVSEIINTNAQRTIDQIMALDIFA